jgi:hypothetical protein
LRVKTGNLCKGGNGKSGKWLQLGVLVQAHLRPVNAEARATW